MCARVCEPPCLLCSCRTGPNHWLLFSFCVSIRYVRTFLLLYIICVMFLCTYMYVNVRSYIEKERERIKPAFSLSFPLSLALVMQHEKSKPLLLATRSTPDSLLLSLRYQLMDIPFNLSHSHPIKTSSVH